MRSLGPCLLFVCVYRHLYPRTGRSWSLGPAPVPAPHAQRRAGMRKVAISVLPTEPIAKPCGRDNPGILPFSFSKIRGREWPQGSRTVFSVTSPSSSFRVQLSPLHSRSVWVGWSCSCVPHLPSPEGDGDRAASASHVPLRRGRVLAPWPVRPNAFCCG